MYNGIRHSTHRRFEHDVPTRRFRQRDDGIINRRRCRRAIEAGSCWEEVAGPMIKCPHCPRQFEDVSGSRDHVEETHQEGEQA